MKAPTLSPSPTFPVNPGHFDVIGDSRETGLPPTTIVHCDGCCDERNRDATHFSQPCSYAWPNSSSSYNYCDECHAYHQAEIQRKAEEAAIQARQVRIHVETICGTGLRYAPGKWVLATDIRGVCLDAGDHIATRLTLRTATCGKIDVTENPWLADLCAELGVRP